MFQAQGLSKSFGGVQVLRNVELGIAPGEVVGLAGPNGSGKSTLIEILSGRLLPDSGTISVNGAQLRHRSEFSACGIFRSYQMPRVFSRLSISDNLTLGRWSLPSWSDVSSAAPEGLPEKSMAAGALSVGQRRRLNLNWLEARLGTFRYFLLDEPTAGADEAFVSLLGLFLEKARMAGAGVLLVEHKRSVLERYSNRLVEIDKGRIRTAATLPSVAAVTEVQDLLRAGHANANDANGLSALEAKNLTVSRGGAIVICDVSLSVSAGETLVVTGANGCGKSSLLLALYGDPRPTIVAGSVFALGQPLNGIGPADRIRRGIHLLPQEKALFDSFTVVEALRASVEAVAPETWTLERVAELRDRVPRLTSLWNRPCGALSGGERRLVGLARLVALAPQIALLDEPLAGLDPRARLEVSGILRDLSVGGSTLVVVEQSDLAHVLRPSRVYCLRNSGIR
jgi:ABC-type branched-subunit amino acid transport system ATPase component